jgi:hypothetical protein
MEIHNAVHILQKKELPGWFPEFQDAAAARS